MKSKRFVIMVIATGYILAHPVHVAPPISATSAESSYLIISQGDTFTANNTGILSCVFEAKAT
jgi:hypothetical protein